MDTVHVSPWVDVLFLVLDGVVSPTYLGTLKLGGDANYE